MSTGSEREQRDRETDSADVGGMAGPTRRGDDVCRMRRTGHEGSLTGNRCGS